MSTAQGAALFFTVALLVIHAYFLFGSVPLLILKHDIALDARFVRGFFDTCYAVSMFTASATAVSYASAGNLAFAAGAGALALLAVMLRRTIIPKMDSIRQQIPVDGGSAIPAFRRLHLAAIIVNLVQLALIAWSVIAYSIQLKG